MCMTLCRAGFRGGVLLSVSLVTPDERPCLVTHRAISIAIYSDVVRINFAVSSPMLAAKDCQMAWTLDPNTGRYATVMHW